MKKVILGSASPRRRELMAQIGLVFEIAASTKEEYYVSKRPKDIVEELALMKADHVASEREAQGVLRNTIVIGADTIVVLGDKILGKPKDEEDAYRMLMGLQGRSHQVYTGVAILDFDDCGERRSYNHAVETKVYVHEMEPEEIRTYIQSKEPMDKAGAYGIQGRFAAYIDKIEGDYYNVVGLPIAYLYQRLKELGAMGGPGLPLCPK